MCIRDRQYVEQKILKKQQKEQEKQRLAVLEQNKKSSAEVANSYVKEKGFDTNTRSEFFTKIGHTVFSTCRKTLDVSKEDEVNAFFQKYKVDVVLHTAIKGGRRNQTDTMANLLENLKMFNNLHNQADSYKLMISFGSGAEKNLDNFYGVAKNAIAKEIENHDGNIINMRLFGCFGPSESNDRFMKNSFLDYFFRILCNLFSNALSRICLSYKKIFCNLR